MSKLFGGGGSKQQEVKETEAEKALAEVNTKRFNRYLRLYRPTQRQHVQDLVGQTQSGEASFLAREAVAGQRFNPVPEEVRQTLGAGASRLLGHHLSQSTAAGLASVNAATLHEERKGSALAAAVNAAIGQESQGIEGLTRSAQASAGYERARALAEQQEDAAKYSALGQIASVPIGAAAKKYGPQIRDKIKDWF